MKKTLIICLVMAMTLSLLAGCCNHEWAEATYKAPATCSLCGKTKGEAIPHDHEWLDATYESPSTCALCEATEGEPLTPDYEKYGLTPPLKVGGTYEFNSVSYDKKTPIKGQTTLVSYEITEEAGKLTFKEGYECHSATFHTLFDAATIQNYGAWVNPSISNYYNLALFDDASNQLADGSYESRVLINGVETPVYLDLKNDHVNNADGSGVIRLSIYLQLPIGYDGMVCGVANPAAVIEDGKTIFDVYTDKDYLLFRMDGKTE